jgi:hypothetical protein
VCVSAHKTGATPLHRRWADSERTSVWRLWRREALLWRWAGGEEEATPSTGYTCTRLTGLRSYCCMVGTSRGAGIEKGYRYLHHQLRSQLTWFGR